MTDINVCSFTGRVGAKEVKPYGDAGKNMITFSLAVNKWNKAKQTNDTMWLNCVCFNDTYAEKVIHKGTMLAVTGALDTGKYNDKTYVKLLVNSVVAMSSKQETEVELTYEQAEQQDDAIPF